MCIAGGFVLGEVLALLPGMVRIGALAALACWCLWCCTGKKSSGKPELWLLLLFFCVSGCVRMGLEIERKPWEDFVSAVNGSQVEILGEVKSISEKEKSVALTLKRCSMVWQQVEYRMPDILVYVDAGEFVDRETIRIGMEVSVCGSLEQPEGGRNPGEFDFRGYYRARGIWYQMFGRDLQVTDCNYRLYSDGLYRLRLAGKGVLERLCEPEDAGIFQAALLGDQSSLQDQVRELYQRNGIAHLLAISGLHISLVGLLCYRMFRKVGLGYGMSGMAGTVIIVSYGILTGASSSVIRAVIMVLVMVVAEYLGRSYDMLSAAALACLILVAEYPYLLFQAGFQLSFGAVVAIGGWGPFLIKKMKAESGLAKALVQGIAIQIVTCPVLLYHFFQYPVYGIFLNLLVIPLMQYVVFSGLAGMALGSVFPELGIAMLGSGHYILEFYGWICGRADELPWANLILGRPKLWQMIVYYGIILVMFWWMRQDRLLWRRRLAAAGSCLLGFFILWRLPFSGIEITFLDVGQGDGICIRTEEGVILVDGGSSSEKELGKYRLEPYLKSQGIRQIDYAVVSHGDSDHISGLQYLLEREHGVLIRNLVLPWLGKGMEVYEDLATLVREQGGGVHWMRDGEGLVCGEAFLTCLYHGNEQEASDMNGHSLVLQLEYGDFGMLLTGDIGRDGELDWISSEEDWESKLYQVLKVAHHGSRYSTCQEVLEMVKPDLAVISCQEGNSYGHPHREVLERLNEKEVRIWRTEESGAITIRSDGTDVWIEEMIDSGSRDSYNRE